LRLLARHGTQQSPEDLAGHAFIHYTLAPRPGQLVLEKDCERVTVKTSARLQLNNGGAVVDAVLAGFGVALTPDFIGTDAFCDGRLQVVRPAWHPAAGSIYAVYPQGGPVTPAVRQFVDALAAQAEALIATSGDRPFAIALDELRMNQRQLVAAPIAKQRRSRA